MVQKVLTELFKLWLFNLPNENILIFDLKKKVLPELSIFCHVVQVWFLIFADVVPFPGSMFYKQQVLKCGNWWWRHRYIQSCTVPITPRPCPLNLTPRVPDTNKLNRSTSVVHLKYRARVSDVPDIEYIRKYKLQSTSCAPVTEYACPFTSLREVTASVS